VPRHIDFDAVRAERLAEPITITLFGQDWTLPPSVPAQTVLLVARLLSDMQDDHGDVDISGLELTPGTVADIAESCIPTPVLQGWFAEGLAVEDLGEILTMLLTEWNVAAAARITVEDGLPEQPAPTGANSDPSASGSSTTGRSSRPTSLASTGSI
jgi:hypothetical protein